MAENTRAVSLVDRIWSLVLHAGPLYTRARLRSGGRVERR